jgi:hypothetical protein
VAHGFREELRHAVDAVANHPLTWPRMEGVPAGTFSHDFPSASCTCYEGARSKSSPLPTVDAGRVTGGREPDQPSNFRMQRSALRAAADPAR